MRINMENIAKQTDMLLNRTGTQEKRTQLFNLIHDYFQEQPQGKQVIYKRGAFYFYSGGGLDFSETTSEPDNNAAIYIFDGSKVTKVNPMMYTGSVSAGASDDGMGLSANNNNNNNNNGNNNG